MGLTHVFSKGEEVANAITHGIGALFSVVALTLLVIQSSLYGTGWHVVSFTIYGVTMLLLYISSTMVHSLRPGKAKDVFEIFDHAAIYLFIAGTYTPILLVVVGGALGWTLFTIVWGLAVVGVVFKVWFAKRFVILSTLFYLLMGWLAIFAFGPIRESLPSVGLWLLVSGGIVYSLGTIFYMWRWFLYHHAIWHMFVVAGSVCHFLLIIRYVLPVSV
ncbi:PAQR family membrane homeostasis protein TrhA [Shouchella lonarensis]|uniref:Hemolysin III n=1 Tax=Shouchella lonarensis TaxID=1464122 RepID=A0A1G6GL04_9BACI|nr:hemolysin III family protein [Shouchella lonarensis]SDB82712.1 hemolysin III [Shouchella lonarensis]